MAPRFLADQIWQKKIGRKKYVTDAPGVIGGGGDGLSRRKFFPIAEHEIPPVAGVKSSYDRLMALIFPRENVCSLEQCIAVRDMRDITPGSGPLQDGMEEVVIHRLHDDSGVRLTLLGYRDVEGPQTPVSGILLTFIKRVAKFRNFHSLPRNRFFQLDVVLDP